MFCSKRSARDNNRDDDQTILTSTTHGHTPSTFGGGHLHSSPPSRNVLSLHFDPDGMMGLEDDMNDEEIYHHLLLRNHRTQEEEMQAILGTGGGAEGSVPPIQPDVYDRLAMRGRIYAEKRKMSTSQERSSTIEGGTPNRKSLPVSIYCMSLPSSPLIFLNFYFFIFYLKKN